MNYTEFFKEVDHIASAFGYLCSVQMPVFKQADMNGTIRICGWHCLLYPAIEESAKPIFYRISLYGDIYEISDANGAVLCSRNGTIKENLTADLSFFLLPKPKEVSVKKDSNMVTVRSWQDFRDTGLLLFINSILHAFGWSIVVEVDNEGHAISAYPARVRYRGFGEKETSEAHKKIGTYLRENAADLDKEANE